MPLVHNTHEKVQQQEAEFRALWREVDALRQKTTAPTKTDPVAPTDPVAIPEGLVKTYSFRIDWNSTFGANGNTQTHYDATVIQAPAFTHLDLWLAMEKCDLAGLGILLSVSIFSTIKQFNSAAGPDLAWVPPVYDVSPSGIYVHGQNSLYEYQMVNNPIIKRIDPIVRNPWSKGDLAYFPITLAGGAQSARLLVTRTVSNANGTARTVCMRGYLTGRYIEHSQAPSQTWLCPTVSPPG